MPSKKQMEAKARAAAKSNNNNKTTTNNNTPAPAAPRILDDLTTKQQPITLPVTSSNNLATWAATVAAVAKASPEWNEFNAEVDSTLNKAIEVARSPLDWYFRLKDIYTKETSPGVFVCTLDELPVPDSDKGNNPAKRKEAGQKADGTLGTIEVDFYKELAKNLRRDLFDDLESLKATGPNGNPNKVLDKHRLLVETQRNAELPRAKNKWTRFQSTIKNAVYIRVMWSLIEQWLPQVTIDYVYQDVIENGVVVGQEIVAGADVFCVSSKTNKTQFKVLSVSNFLKLDPEAASKMKNGGTVLELLATLARGTTNNTPAAVPQMTWSRFEQTNAEYAAFISDEKNLANLTDMAMKKKLNPGYIRSLGKIIMGLDVVWKHIQQDYLKLDAEDRQAAADEAKRRAALNEAQG